MDAGRAKETHREEGKDMKRSININISLLYAIGTISCWASIFWPVYIGAAMTAAFK